MLFTLSSIVRYTLLQARHGNRHIWRSSLSRFDPRASIDFGHGRAPSVFHSGAAGMPGADNANGNYNAFMPGVKW